MKHKTSDPSQLQWRVAEQIRHIIAETLQRGHFHDEALLNSAGITVSEVRISPDLKNATAFVMSLGGENMNEILPALNENAKTFQKEINRGSNLKFTPRIKFVTDETFDEVQKIENLLREVHIPNEE